MDPMVLRAFVDELSKVADSNMLAPAGMKSGMGSNSMVASVPRVGVTSPMKKDPAAKPTNYSIVHSQAPMAAHGTASATSKAVPPPPVRT